ncbi:MAG: HAMP domain-containing histidine kinase [Dysgonamonadaceae bacterium]|jgi:signal transduction histidine kinase|nr:HAMP domain-containing histidine kinase [Dysgonamonadaceae bacterium]
MYEVWRSEMKREMRKALEIAVDMELSDRSNKLGGGIFYRTFEFTSEDYQRGYIKKKITTQDSTLYVNIDPRDPDADRKIIQFILKDEEKINLRLLDSIFVSELKKHHFQINASYVEYHDLKNNKLLESSKPDRWYCFSCSTDMTPIDILSTLGVRAFVSSGLPAFLKQMLLQLILSVLLIILASTGLFYLLKTIFTQRKIENLRQGMINAMTHEFRRPIANARLLLDMTTIYLESGSVEKIKSNIQKADFQLDRLSAYNQQIMRINWNEHHRIDLEPKQISIPDFINAYSENYRDAADIQIFIDTSINHFTADEIHFTNVMDNLVENAVKYSDSRAQITIRVYEVNSKLIFSVKDQGIGMNSSDKKHIFEKFYRINSKKVMKKDGFGLGLTYVKAVIEAHHGNVSVDSEPDKGSVFYVEIPLSVI